MLQRFDWVLVYSEENKEATLYIVVVQNTWARHYHCPPEQCRKRAQGGGGGGFACIGYPSAAASVDGKHFRCIVKSFSDTFRTWGALESNSHFSRLMIRVLRISLKRFFSIVLLAVADANCRFLMFSCGRKGKYLIRVWLELRLCLTLCSSTFKFRTSSHFLHEAVSRQSGQRFSSKPLEDCGIGHYHMLCDGRFPLTTYMQKPFNQIEAATLLK